MKEVPNCNRNPPTEHGAEGWLEPTQIASNFFTENYIAFWSLNGISEVTRDIGVGMASQNPLLRRNTWYEFEVGSS